MFAEIDLTFSILKLNQMQLSNEELIDLLITKYLNTGIVLFFTLATVYCMFHRTIVRVIYITSFCVFFSFSMWMLIDEKASVRNMELSMLTDVTDQSILFFRLKSKFEIKYKIIK